MLAAEIVRRFRGLRALVLGDAMLDSYVEGTAERLCSEGPVPVVHAATEHHYPGGAANSAANLRALGADVMFVGVTGRDQPGAQLRERLRRLGVDDRWLVDDGHVATLHKRRVVADGQYVVRVDDGHTGGCSPDGWRRLLANLDDAFARCDLVVVSDYGYGVVSELTVARLRALREARRSRCVLAIDSKQLRGVARAGATVVTPNLLEARLAVDENPAARSPGGPAEAERVGRRLLELLDSDMLAITLAAGGVLLLTRNGAPLHVPAHPVERPNVAGAGDTFTAALALALAVGATPAEAARIGVDAASISVAKARTAVAGHQELLQRASLHDLADASPDHRADVARLADKLLVDRLAGRIVVFTNGVFDILHAGHVDFLRRAKAQGDVLVVGVNTDAGARRLKGRNRPINGERDRLALLAALEPVDHAVLFDEDTPEQLIRALRPRLHVKGGDYAGEALPEAAAVREVGGEVVILPLVGGHSTSGLIDRIVSLAANAPDSLGMAASHD